MEPRSAERGNQSARNSLGRLIALSCFNGATLSRAWKPSGPCGRHSVGAAASMEPRSAERGNGELWKLPRASSVTLQWSHAQPSVETRTGLKARVTRASMEPRSAERGNYKQR